DVVAERNWRSVVEDVYWRRRLDAQAEHRTLLRGALVEKEIVLVQVDRHAKLPLGGRNARHVIDVRMRQQDEPHVELMPAHGLEQLDDLVARIDHDGLPRPLASDHKAVLVEGWRG